MAATFDAATRALYPTLGEALDEHERLFSEYTSRFRIRYVSDGALGALTTRDKVLSHLLSVLPRARSLSRSVIVETNAGLAAGLFLAARAHFEMAAELAFFQSRLMTGKWDDRAFERLFFARRSWPTAIKQELVAEGTDPKSFNPESVMNYIDAVDSLESDPDQRGKFRIWYEWLSEYCHPNMLSRVPFLREFTSDGVHAVILFDELDSAIPQELLERVLAALRVSHNPAHAHNPKVASSNLAPATKAGTRG